MWLYPSSLITLYAVRVSDGNADAFPTEGNILGLRSECLRLPFTLESILFHKGLYPTCALPEPKLQWCTSATFSWENNHLWFIMSWYNTTYEGLWEVPGTQISLQQFKPTTNSLKTLVILMCKGFYLLGSIREKFKWYKFKGTLK